jgi:hypothetical protein
MANSQIHRQFLSQQNGQEWQSSVSDLQVSPFAVVALPNS